MSNKQLLSRYGACRVVPLLITLLVNTPAFATDGWRIGTRDIATSSSTEDADNRIAPSSTPQPVTTESIPVPSSITVPNNQTKTERARDWWKNYRSKRNQAKTDHKNSNTNRTPRLQARVWKSKGSTTWSHNASQFDSFLGNPTSRLDYQNAGATLLEVGAEMDLPQGFYLAANFGSGDINSGVLQDDDFISAEGAAFIGTSQQGEHAFSSTDSDIYGQDVRYFDIKLGKSLVNHVDKQVGVFAQYQDWREHYRAKGIRQTVCTAPNILCAPQGFSGFNDTSVISNRAHWRSLYLGMDGKTRVGDKLLLSGSLAYTPKADVDNRDVHFLRDDLAKDPSLLLQGSGRGYKIGLNAEYAFTPRLSGTFGWRYWQLKANARSSGVTFFPSGGGLPIDVPLKELETKRKGITVGLSYRLGDKTNAN